MNETIVYHGITFHLIPGQKPCFQYDIENAVYTGYIDPDIDMDSLMELDVYKRQIFLRMMSRKRI